MSKEQPREKSTGSMELNGSSRDPAPDLPSGENAPSGAAEAPADTAADRKNTIEDLLRLVDELQRKSADHDGKLRELGTLLAAPHRQT